jgi:hypothetical protein
MGTEAEATEDVLGDTAQRIRPAPDEQRRAFSVARKK